MLTGGRKWRSEEGRIAEELESFMGRDPRSGGWAPEGLHQGDAQKTFVFGFNLTAFPGK